MIKRTAISISSITTFNRASQDSGLESVRVLFFMAVVCLENWLSRPENHTNVTPLLGNLTYVWAIAIDSWNNMKSHVEGC